MAKNVKKPKPKVKHVVLPKAGVVQVVVPAGVVPVVGPFDPVRKVVEIAPLPVARKRTWWQTLFGG